MNLKSLISVALRSLWRNKTRSILTMLGVIIGVMSVILLLAIGSGIQRYIVNEFESMGSNMVIVNPGEDTLGGGGGIAQMGSQFSSMANSKLRYEDVRDLKRLRQYVTAVIPEFMMAADVEYKTEAIENASIYGTSEDLVIMDTFKIGRGNFYDQKDVDSKRRIVVLGSKAATELFGQVDPVGKGIKISGSPFKVVGVMAEGGGLMGASMNEMLIIPITTAHDLADSNLITSLNIQVKDKDIIPQAEIEITKTLLKRLKKDDFHIMNQEQILGTINNILSILSAALGGIAAISLLVGGIGIMNIMLVSVTERTREIGLRKAVGATPKVIMMQFLIESVTLSVSGGLLGVALAFGITLIMQQFFPAQVPLWSVLLAFGVSAAVGIIFGVYPARKASQLSPIEALRYE